MPIPSPVRDFDWEGIWLPTISPLEVMLRAAIIYLVLVVIFRLVPRKELGRYSISDIILLLLLTTAVRRTIVMDDDSITTAFVGLGTLLGLNYGLNQLSRLGSTWSNVIQGRRVLLVREGEPQYEGMRYAKLSHRELIARLRESGTEDLERVEEAYLERDGQVTFVLRDHDEEKRDG